MVILCDFDDTVAGRNIATLLLDRFHHAPYSSSAGAGGVPFFASLSFAFLTYFGYSVARTLLSRLERRGSDIQLATTPRMDGALLVLVLAALITTWADTITDPVAHLGRYWFLGDLYTYEGQGIHFDVPLSNYAGWIFSSLLIVFVNQRFGDWLRARRATSDEGFYLPFKPLWAVGSLLGNFVFMIGVMLYLLASDEVPASASVGQMLASGLALSGLFVVFAAVMIRRGLTRDPEPVS